jgi:hypothetical protein
MYVKYSGIEREYIIKTHKRTVSRVFWITNHKPYTIKKESRFKHLLDLLRIYYSFKDCQFTSRYKI